jgi:hypothetical protein
MTSSVPSPKFLTNNWPVILSEAYFSRVESLP